MRTIYKFSSLSFCSFAILCLLAATAQAGDFQDKVQRILKDHSLIKMVDADVATAEAGIDTQKSAWFPKLSVHSALGSEHINKDYGENGGSEYSKATVDLNQLVYDFGITSSRINKAEKIAEKERAENALQRQNLLLAAVEAQLSLIKAHKVLEFAKTSENSLKNQALLEKKRVEGGQGYSTDILQAKAQLAGSEANRIKAESDKAQAKYRYHAIFSVASNNIRLTPVNVDALEGLFVPAELIPASLLEVEQMTLANNPDILTANARSDIESAMVAATAKEEYMPRVDLNLNSGYYKNPDENRGERKDVGVELRFNWKFDLGMKARTAVTSAKLSERSSREKGEYVRSQALEEARNSWSSWKSSHARTIHLTSQVEISSEFLKLARRERMLGRRSLLDILNAEVSLLSAQSNAVEAKIEEVIASFRLLRAIGKLDMDIFATSGLIVPQSFYAPQDVTGLLTTNESHQSSRLETIGKSGSNDNINNASAKTEQPVDKQKDPVTVSIHTTPKRSYAATEQRSPAPMVKDQPTLPATQKPTAKTPEISKQVQVVKDANIRMQPHLDSTIVAVALRDEIVQEISGNKHWRKVKTLNGVSGWLAAELVQPVSKQKKRFESR